MWVPTFFSWVFRESESFSREYFVGSRFFFSWVFRGSKGFSREYVGGPRIFFSGVFRGFNIFSRGYFVGAKFFLVNISWLTREYITEECEQINATLFPHLIRNKLHLRIIVSNFSTHPL